MLSKEFEDMRKVGEWVIQSQMELDGSISYVVQHLVDGYPSQTTGWFKSVEDAQKYINTYLFSEKDSVS